MQYKEFIRKAARDESTLISLENQLRLVELEEAKLDDPWELITKPTLLKYPVAPSKKKIALIGLSIGLLISLLISLIKEKRSGKIYDLESLENLLLTQTINSFILYKIFFIE